MNKLTQMTLTAMILALSGTVALAVVPLRIPLQGVIRDNAGVPVVEDVFSVTFSLYDSPEAADPVWVEPWPADGESCEGNPGACVHVVNGRFRVALGAHAPLDVSVLQAADGLWLGVSVEGEPELPRRPLGSSPYALLASHATHANQADSASNLTCTGCIAPEALSNETVLDLLDTTLQAVGNAGYVTQAQLSAGAVPFDGALPEMSAGDVQSAIEELKALIEEKTAGLEEGGGDAVEGAGSVSRYTNQWGLPSYGVAKEYVHLMHPTQAKLILHLYGGENSGFASSNNLIVSNTYTPNSYSGGANGVAGDDTMTVTNAGAFNPGDHILIHQTIGNDPGHWELNAVQTINGNSLKLAKALAQNYLSDDNSGSGMNRAQVVIAASYNTFEVINGGTVRPAATLDAFGQDDYHGGIVYVRARQITVKSGGAIHADGYGHGAITNNASWGMYAAAGASECGYHGPTQKAANCSGGGGGYPVSCCCSHNSNRGSGGGGNRTAGERGFQNNGAQDGGEGGQTKGSEGDGLLHFGGAGGEVEHYDGGRGGGLVVLGADTIIVQAGGRISADGGDGNDGGCRAGTGGGAGGTVALFSTQTEVEEPISVQGGNGYNHTHASANGGDGGEGWVQEHPPIPGVINQSYATGVQIWVDGEEVTPQIGDPNGKGSPHWNAQDEAWGATGTEAWSSGPLDITNVTDWTLGEHLIEFKETGGAGGDLKSYLYVIQTFSEATPPLNDTCSSPLSLELGDGSVVVSGSTEDVMGKLKATDAYQGTCGGAGGPDAVYRIDLEERSLINVATVAPHDLRMYLREGSCASGTEVYCAVNDFSTTPLEAGTYYLFVDGDTPLAKGDYTLAVSLTPALIPENDTCDTAIALAINDDTGVASFSGSSLYSLDQHSSFCGGGGGPDVVHSFSGQAGQTLKFEVTSDAFAPILHLYQDACAQTGAATCSMEGTITTPMLTKDTEFWMTVDSAEEKGWGDYTITVTPL